MAEILSYTDACIQGSSPPCTCACPVKFNPRVFIEKLRNGNYEAAHREFANQVIFPGIVSRICPQQCYNICSEKIEMLRLEQACISHAVNKDPIRYNLPPRKETIAIIGAGICGMACAHRLTTRRYDVTIFECAGSAGGSLNHTLGKSVVAEEFALQFKHLKYRLEFNRRITSLEELNFDAVFIATGSGGSGYGMLKTWNSASMATGREGIFLGGKLTGGSDMNALMHGMAAAASIEKYLKVKIMTGQTEISRQTECMISPPEPTNRLPVIPAEGENYSKEEAAAEAARCRLCDCTLCRDSCEFLKHMDILPRKVESDAKMAASALKGLYERVGTRMIVSCSVCGHCGSVCPNDINVEDILIRAKKQLFEDGCFAPALHDFYLRDMELALNEAYLAKAVPHYETSRYVFFPGCQMTASGTEHVEKAYTYMLEKYPDTSLMLGCCGVPALWAGNHKLLNKVLRYLESDWLRLGKPKFVTGCSTCAKTFSTYYPEFETLSLYEFICQNGIPSGTRAFTGTWAVFDPCSSRDFPAMQKSVRELTKSIDIKVTELPCNSHKALCCGMGGHIYPANPAVFNKMLSAAISQSDLPYIVYCTNCRNLFVKAGKSSMHILDAVFGAEPLEKPFHISELRKNRLALKKRMLKDIWGECMNIMEKQYTVKLTFSEEVYDKMDSLHISEEDVYDAVEYCEKNNETVLDTESGILTGHLQIGIITYWVQYRKESADIEIVNVYCHRLKVT